MEKSSAGLIFSLSWVLQSNSSGKLLAFAGGRDMGSTMEKNEINTQPLSSMQGSNGTFSWTKCSTKMISENQEKCSFYVNKSWNDLIKNW